MKRHGPLEHGIAELVRALRQHHDNIFLAWEVEVYGSLGAVDALGYLAHGEAVIAFLEKHLTGHLEDPLLAFPNLPLLG